MAFEPPVKTPKLSWVELFTVNWTRGRLLVTTLFVVLVLGLVVVGSVSYFAIGLGPETDALAAVEADDRITVAWSDAGYVVYAEHTTASGTADRFIEGTDGFVLYPGARVAPESYVPTAAAIAAERDVVVVIPHVPLNLAILATDRADRAIATYPGIDRWYVGGHSLGGVAACRYAADDSDRVAGLVLFASYCDRDLSTAELPVLSVLATHDGVIDAEAERQARTLLPADATLVEIEGMNHAQFGAYGPQRGDDPAGIDDRTARTHLAEAVVDWLDDRSVQYTGGEQSQHRRPSV